MSIYHDLDYLQKWLKSGEKIAEVRFVTTKNFKQVSAFDEYEFICWHNLESVSS